MATNNARRNALVSALASILGLAAVAHGQAPANDDCANATVVLLNLPVQFDTRAATPSPLPVDDALCGGTYLNWGTNNPDVWFRWTPTVTLDAVVSTCDSSSFDTSIVVYTGTCNGLTPIGCNGDGRGLVGCQTFYSAVPFTAVANTTYFIRVGGYSDGVGVAHTGTGLLSVRGTVSRYGCRSNAPITQVVGQQQTGALGGLVGCQVDVGYANCSTGGTVRNRYARVVPAAQVLDTLNCLAIGVWSTKKVNNDSNGSCMYVVSDIPLPAKISIYRDVNGGAPVNAFTPSGACPDGSCDLVHLYSFDVLLPGGAYKGIINFEPPLCFASVPSNQNLVIVMDCPDLYGGSLGVPAAAGYDVRAAGKTMPGESPSTYCRVSCVDGSGRFVLATTLGPQWTNNWPIELIGSNNSCSQSSCLRDLDSDGVTDGIDLGIFLSTWGPCSTGACPSDFNQDGAVDGIDLGELLSAWGPCGSG
jgi:hypothetical protein